MTARGTDVLVRSTITIFFNLPVKDILQALFSQHLLNPFRGVMRVICNLSADAGNHSGLFALSQDFKPPRQPRTVAVHHRQDMLTRCNV